MDAECVNAHVGHAVQNLLASLIDGDPSLTFVVKRQRSGLESGGDGLFLIGRARAGDVVAL